MYTDNWYTSVPLARHILKNYGWLFAGTVKLTEKKARVDYDITFHKLSMKALEMVPRGWSRRGTVEVDGVDRRKAKIQFTTWKDRKQVAFIHTHLVRPIGDNTALRYVKWQQGRIDTMSKCRERLFSFHEWG